MAAIDNRKMEYEMIRVVAMIFTIAVHVLSILPRCTQGEEYLYDGLTLIFYTCNALFFMLSGKFAIAVKCESFQDYYNYYVKKVINLVIPILFYMFLRTVYELGGEFWEISFWKSYIHNVLSDYSQREFWFLYVLLGMILLAPFFNKMCATLKSGEMWILITFGILYNAICSYGSYLQISFSWNYILGGWGFYFILGYCLEKVIDTPFKENMVIISGTICFVISFILKQFDLISGIHDLAPTFTLISCAMFFLLKRHSVKNKYLISIIRQCGKYSFAIYMIHNAVNEFLLGRISLGDNYLVKLIVLTGCSFGISFIVAFVCENTVVKILKSVANRIFLRGNLLSRL